MKAGTTYHLCVKIEPTLKMIARGDRRADIFNVSPARAAGELIAAQKQGKTYYSGCSRMGKDGRCRGHRPKKAV